MKNGKCPYVEDFLQIQLFSLFFQRHHIDFFGLKLHVNNLDSTNFCPVGFASDVTLGTEVNSTSFPCWFKVISLKWCGNNVDSTSVCLVGCIEMKSTRCEHTLHVALSMQAEYLYILSFWSMYPLLSLKAVTGGSLQLASLYTLPLYHQLMYGSAKAIHKRLGELGSKLCKLCPSKVKQIMQMMPK